MDTLKLKKAWEVAIAPAKQLPMSAIGSSCAVTPDGKASEAKILRRHVHDRKQSPGFLHHDGLHALQDTHHPSPCHPSHIFAI